MGRKKISIKPIEDEKLKRATFNKRRAGLFKKAHELSVLCGCEVGLIMINNDNNNVYQFANQDMNQLLFKYSGCPDPYESRNNEDFRRLMERKAAEQQNHDDNSDNDDEDGFAEFDQQGPSDRKPTSIQTQGPGQIKQRRFPYSKPSPTRNVNFEAFQQFPPLSPISRQLGGEYQQQFAQPNTLPSLNAQLGYLNTPTIPNYSSLNNNNMFNWTQPLNNVGQFDYNFAPAQTEVSPKRRFTELNPSEQPATGKAKDISALDSNSASQIQSIKKARI